MYLATGHYANITKSTDEERYYISRGKDIRKDQSYFLWKLKSPQISRTLFPLGNFNKSEIRDIAERHGLKVSKKPESQEVCFIPDNDYRGFIQTMIPEEAQKNGLGNFVLDGKVVGRHSGYFNFTVGQRRGLGISNPLPLYVKHINAITNEVVIAVEEDLFSSHIVADDVNLVKYDKLDENKIFNVKIRYRDKGTEATCKVNESGLLEVSFLEPKRAIAPGQSVVIYEGDDLVGGGIIREAF